MGLDESVGRRRAVRLRAAGAEKPLPLDAHGAR